MNDYFWQIAFDGYMLRGYNNLPMESSKKTPGTVFIALSGKKQVGKDTAKEMLFQLLSEQRKSVRSTAFAEPLKDLCINILGLNRKLVYGTNEDKDTRSHLLWDSFPLDIRLKYSNLCDDDGRDLPRTGFMTVREVLQVVGTDVFRAIEDNVWANAPFNRTWTEDVVIISDCRFPNEKKVVEDNGGIVIRLERETGFNDTHPSETALDKATFDTAFTYSNNGSLAELWEFLRGVLEKLELIKHG